MRSVHGLSVLIFLLFFFFFSDFMCQLYGVAEAILTCTQTPLISFSCADSVVSPNDLNVSINVRQHNDTFPILTTKLFFHKLNLAYSEIISQ